MFLSYFCELNQQPFEKNWKVDLAPLLLMAHMAHEPAGGGHLEKWPQQEVHPKISNVTHQYCILGTPRLQKNIGSLRCGGGARWSYLATRLLDFPAKKIKMLENPIWRPKSKMAAKKAKMVIFSVTFFLFPVFLGWLCDIMIHTGRLNHKKWLHEFIYV